LTSFFSPTPIRHHEIITQITIVAATPQPAAAGPLPNGVFHDIFHYRHAAIAIRHYRIPPDYQPIFSLAIAQIVSQPRRVSRQLLLEAADVSSAATISGRWSFIAAWLIISTLPISPQYAGLFANIVCRRLYAVIPILRDARLLFFNVFHATLTAITLPQARSAARLRQYLRRSPRRSVCTDNTPAFRWAVRPRLAGPLLFTFLHRIIGQLIGPQWHYWLPPQ